MMMPSIFGENLFDDWMDYPFRRSFMKPFKSISMGNPEEYAMKTDIKEHENSYELTMELPGYKKEDVSAQLEDGYLTIQASRSSENGEKDEEGNYIRQERYYGKCQRSFYVGETMKEEDIKAKFENGILHLEFPKLDKKQQVEQKKYIPIEG